MRVLRAILIAVLLFPQILRAQTSFDPGEGCLNVVEFTAGPGLGTFGDRLIGANYLHERFINELFSVGAGAGYSYHQQYQFSALPVYFSSHYFFTDNRFSPLNQPGLSLFVSPGAGVKVHLTSHIGLMASVSYDGYLVNAFDSAKNNYHTSMVPNLGINFGMCFQIPGW